MNTGCALFCAGQLFTQRAEHFTPRTDARCAQIRDMRLASGKLRLIHQQRQFTCLSVHPNNVVIAYFCQQSAIIGLRGYMDG